MQQTVIQAWLDDQCGQIGGATGGVVMLDARAGGKALTSAASWPPAVAPVRNWRTRRRRRSSGQQALSQGRMNGAAASGPDRVR